MTSLHRAWDTRIFHKECRSLAEMGYEVILIAPHDRSEMVDGVRVRAVDRPKHRRDRMTRVLWQIYRCAMREDAQLYHFHDPELIAVGTLLKLRGKRVVYDAHEDLPRQIMTKPWIHARLRRVVSVAAEVAEWVAGRGLDGVIGATPTIANRFPSSKSETVLNYPKLREFAATTPYPDRPQIVTYVGSVSAERGVRHMVEAMGGLPEASTARLSLAGEVTRDLLPHVQGLPGWKRVDLLQWQSREQVAELLGRTRVGLVVLQPIQNYMDAYPVKLFEYMSAGVPVVASDFPIIREIVDAAKAGLLVDPTDPTAIGNAIQWLLNNPAEAGAMGNRGKEAAHSRYDWEGEARKLKAFYERVM